MLVVFPERVSLPVLGTRRILWNHLKSELGDGGQALRSILLDKACCILLPKGLHLLGQQLNLIEK
ncbi:MAG: hypothetical protein EBY24_19420 [Betaproteobacteria bacterium]|nr:hypothetical protein [Betaproteobacteria bacterium]